MACSAQPDVFPERFFVVSNSEIESSNLSTVYIHGVTDGYQARASSEALFPNGSDMTLAKLELGNDLIISPHCCISLESPDCVGQVHLPLYIALTVGMEKHMLECKVITMAAVAFLKSKTCWTSILMKSTLAARFVLMSFTILVLTDLCNRCSLSLQET